MTGDAAMLARVERRAGLIAAAAMVIAWPLWGIAVSLSVAGGALLITTSYWAIKRGVSGLTSAVVEGADARGRTRRSLIILVGRYALLALIAYVMISRLRLSPIGVLVGVSVLPAAVMLEALATLRTHGKV